MFDFYTQLSKKAKAKKERSENKIKKRKENVGSGFYARPAMTFFIALAEKKASAAEVREGPGPRAPENKKIIGLGILGYPARRKRGRN